MEVKTTEDIFQLLDGYIISSALGTALELGLFWIIAERPLQVSEISQDLGIPFNRCKLWLDVLCKHNLLKLSEGGYRLSDLTEKSILGTYSQDSWAFLAREGRFKYSAVRDLAVNMRIPKSTWELQNLTPPDYTKMIRENPTEATRFTRMLYEIHIPLAEQISTILDLGGVKKVMDLGGGSGVVSFALIRKKTDLTSVVVDVENVCVAGQKIAEENGLENRIEYLVANYLEDELPSGFDLVIFCDAGPYSEDIFRKICKVLNPDGRLVIVYQFALEEDVANPSRLLWSFLSSMESPKGSLNFTTSDQIHRRLKRVGFQDLVTTTIPFEENLRWNTDWVMLEGRKSKE
jgi:predicted O-methyltransferase YrrM